MSISLTMPQADLLRQLKAAGARGVLKSRKYTPAEHLVSDGLARWAQRHGNDMGTLVATPRGMEWGQ